MFWSVAEPTAYYTNWYGTPLNAVARTPAGADAALGATMFHWGLHPWAIYAVVGLSLAFFTYNKGLPLTIRSGFYPLLKDRTWGWFGHVIDSITAGGKLDAPVPQRIFWATMKGIIAAALLFGGGADALGALQAAAITVGLPFTLVLLVMCVGLYMGLAHEWRYVQGPNAQTKE